VGFPRGIPSWEVGIPTRENVPTCGRWECAWEFPRGKWEFPRGNRVGKSSLVGIPSWENSSLVGIPRGRWEFPQGKNLPTRLPRGNSHEVVGIPLREKFPRASHERIFPRGMGKGTLLKYLVLKDNMLDNKAVKYIIERIRWSVKTIDLSDNRLLSLEFKRYIVSVAKHCQITLLI